MITVLTCHISLHSHLLRFERNTEYKAPKLFENKTTIFPPEGNIKYCKEQIRVWPYFPHQVSQQVLFLCLIQWKFRNRGNYAHYP